MSANAFCSWFYCCLCRDSLNYIWWPCAFSKAGSIECLIWVFQNNNLMANRASHRFPLSGTQGSLFLIAVDNWPLALIFPNFFTFLIQLVSSLFQLLVIHTLGWNTSNIISGLLFLIFKNAFQTLIKPSSLRACKEALFFLLSRREQWKWNNDYRQ